MTERELGAAVIGLGVGKAHIRGYQAVEGVRVVAIADVNSKALAAAQEQFGVPLATTDFREALDNGDVDVVSICTPDRFHAEQATYALERGKHVLCEKPIAISTDELVRLSEVVERTGMVYAAGHNYRFIPQFQAFGPDYWRFKDPQDLFIGGAVHNVDLLQWLAGEVVEVHSYANKVLDFWPVESNYTTNLKFKNGCIGHVLLELGAKRKTKFDVRLRAFGIDGSIEADNRLPQVVRDLGEAPGEEPEVVAVPEGNAHAREIAHFVECVRAGTEPLVGVRDGARVMAVCFAAVQSARTGQAVGVEYLE